MTDRVTIYDLSLTTAKYILEREKPTSYETPLNDIPKKYPPSLVFSRYAHKPLFSRHTHEPLGKCVYEEYTHDKWDIPWETTRKSVVYLFYNVRHTRSA